MTPYKNTFNLWHKNIQPDERYKNISELYYSLTAPKDDMVRVNLTTSNMRKYFFIGAEVVDQDKDGYVTILCQGELFVSEEPLPQNFAQMYRAEEYWWRLE